MQLRRLEESEFKQWKKETLCVAPTPVLYCGFRDMKGIVYQCFECRWVRCWSDHSQETNERVRILYETVLLHISLAALEGIYILNLEHFLKT